MFSTCLHSPLPPGGQGEHRGIYWPKLRWKFDYHGSQAKERRTNSGDYTYILCLNFDSDSQAIISPDFNLHWLHRPSNSPASRLQYTIHGDVKKEFNQRLWGSGSPPTNMLTIASWGV